MAEQRVSFAVSWHWPDGETFETISSLNIHEAQGVEDTLNELLSDDGFGDINVETAGGKTPATVGAEELYRDSVAEALMDAGFDELAEQLLELVDEKN